MALTKEMKDILNAADKRVADLEAFVRKIENIETAWVTGIVNAQASMKDVSDAWHKVRRQSDE